MKRIAAIIALGLFATVGAYHVGHSRGYAQANTEWDTTTHNDYSGDPTLTHSRYWEVGYTHGKMFGVADANARMMDRCSTEIIKVTAATNAPKALGMAMVDGFVDPAAVQALAPR
jgi:hypothetical protein